MENRNFGGWYQKKKKTHFISSFIFLLLGVAMTDPSGIDATPAPKTPKTRRTLSRTLHALGRRQQFHFKKSVILRSSGKRGFRGSGTLCMRDQQRWKNGSLLLDPIDWTNENQVNMIRYALFGQYFQNDNDFEKDEARERKRCARFLNPHPPNPPPPPPPPFPFPGVTPEFGESTPENAPTDPDDGFERWDLTSLSSGSELETEVDTDTDTNANANADSSLDDLVPSSLPEQETQWINIHSSWIEECIKYDIDPDTLVDISKLPTDDFLSLLKQQ